MAANTRGRTPVRAARLRVESLEHRDVASAAFEAAPGYVVDYAEGYEYGDGTAIGWATGSYTVVTAEEPVATVAVEPAAVGVESELSAEAEQEPEPTYFAPPIDGGVIADEETVADTTVQPAGEGAETRVVAVTEPIRKDAGSDLPHEFTDAGTPAEPSDEADFGPTLAVWVG